MPRAPVPSDYAVLGLRPGATAAQVREAFRRLAKQLHPDRNPGDASARERFEQVTESYAALRGAGRSGTGPMPRSPRPGVVDDGGSLAELAPGAAMWVQTSAIVVAPDRTARLSPASRGSMFPSPENTVRVHRRPDGHYVFMPPQPVARWPLLAEAAAGGLEIAALWIGDRQEDDGAPAPRMPRRLLAATIADMATDSTGWAAAAALRRELTGRWMLDGAEPIGSEPHLGTPLRILRDAAGHWVYADLPAASWPAVDDDDGRTLIAVAGGLLDGAPIHTHDGRVPG